MFCLINSSSLERFMSNFGAEPILTESFDDIDLFIPLPGSTYIFADNGEARSKHLQGWMNGSVDVTFMEVKDQTPSSFNVDILSFMSRRLSDMELFIEKIETRLVYLDITGLMHAVWAPILKALVQSGKEVKATYVEPDEYTRSTAPLEGQIYDLSASISGTAPLPGFAVLSQSLSTDFIFVPLLGFEGMRFRYLIEQVQPSNEHIVPIVGLPGFKTWYVFETYLGNAPALRETKSWQSVRYASANCPFSCFYLLRDIATEFPSHLMKIAPIGTKPHALGAIMFALSASAPIEIVYDNPIRKLGRTFGSDRLFVYNISAVLNGFPSA
jgi:hypothetical protein